MEVWKSIEGYEGLYEVSNLGNIKRVSSYITNKNNAVRFYPGRILKQEKIYDGYLRVILSKNGKHKRFMSHRLVAQMFIPNEQQKPFVNHINGIKTDNRACNLEWCTQEENEQHSVHVLGKTMRGKTYPKPVICVNTQQYFPSMQACVRYIGNHACIEGLNKAIKANRPYHGYKFIRA